jgi:hypothetical protein
VKVKVATWLPADHRSGRSRVINRIALKFVDVPQNSLARSHNGAIEEQGNRAIAENLKSFATSE